MPARSRETFSERRARERAEEDARRGEHFRKTRNAQTSYGAQLRAFARQIIRIIEAFRPADGELPSPGDLGRLEAAMIAYARASTPWARATAARMIAEVDRRSLTAWERYTRGMGTALRQELRSAPVGERVLELLGQQVRLITTLPIEASRRVHEKTHEAITASSRYQERTWIELGEGERKLPPRSELAEALAAANPQATEQWLRNRATLIARTETARTASVLVQARSDHIGAEEYEWLTAGDWKVRESHRKLNHSRQRWDDPPLCDPPDHHAHPGQIWNCRCTALPIIPE